MSTHISLYLNDNTTQNKTKPQKYWNNIGIQYWNKISSSIVNSLKQYNTDELRMN